MKKLLIIGRGQIGSALAHDLTSYNIQVWPSDIADLTTDELEKIAPDAVINAAGKTDLAWCEANAREAIRSNLEAPVELYGRILRYAGGRDVRYIHLSSGCIWDGPYDSKGNPFTPDSPASPACLYSWTKAAADAMLLAMGQEHLAILRPRQVYSSSASPRNTLVKLMKYPKLVDTTNTMSSLAIIEKTIRHVVDAKSDWQGVWNVYDAGVITPLGVGEMLYVAGLRAKPSAISKAELDRFHTPRRVDAVLYDARFEKQVEPGKLHEELLRTIQTLKQHVSVEQPLAA